MGFCLQVSAALFSFGSKILDECGISFDTVTKRTTFIADVFIPEVPYITKFVSLN